MYVFICIYVFILLMYVGRADASGSLPTPEKHSNESINPIFLLENDGEVQKSHPASSENKISTCIFSFRCTGREGESIDRAYFLVH
jgi:hypothetical protein